MLGRSNVGKSSVINALAARKGLAKVSSTPGRTRLLNAFAVTDDTLVVDCPGYGYAKASRTDRDAWMRMVEDYLLDREPLVDLLLLGFLEELILFLVLTAFLHMVPLPSLNR